jgi:hypothetical protein
MQECEGKRTWLHPRHGIGLQWGRSHAAAEMIPAKIPVGRMGEKNKALMTVKNEAAGRGETTSPIIFIDGLRRPSASKL